MVFHMQPDLVWGYFGGIFAEYRKGAIPPMPLTEIQARNSKPRERAYKLADGEGLFLFVQPNGSKLWRMKYRFAGKEKLLFQFAIACGLRLWREASTIAGSPAEKYLVSRGITISSPELRFHPHMPLGPKGAVRFLPAMVAAVRNDAGILALHRSFLDLDKTSLASFDQPRRALGSPGSGAVRFAYPDGGRLGLAEGNETALSAMQMFNVPCWATLGNERFGLATIPESVRQLYLFVDNDAGGHLAEERAREAYACEGRLIVTRRPELTGDDWNDVLMRSVRATV